MRFSSQITVANNEMDHLYSDTIFQCTAHWCAVTEVKVYIQ